MKTQKILAMGTIMATMFALLNGCANINSNNIGRDIKPLPYSQDELARTTKKTMVSTNECGGVITFEEITKSGLQVNSEIQHHKLEMATKVGVAQAGSSGDGRLISGFGQTPGYGYVGANNAPIYYPGGGKMIYSGGGGFYGGGGSYSPPSVNSSPNYPGGGGASSGGGAYWGGR